MKQIVHLYFYTDSVGFPRIDTQSIQQTWPFLLTELLEAKYGVQVYPLHRGLGGATISEIYNVFLRDIGYFRGQGSDTASIVILNTGVVEASPQPFTFFLRGIARIPLVGPKIWQYVRKPLVANRPLLQRICSYRRTNPRHFSLLFRRIIRLAKRQEMQVFSIDTPLTPVAMESRSPGLRSSIGEYNSIKRQNNNIMHLDMSWCREECFLEDGHHFTLEAHKLLSEQLLNQVSACLN